jgi:hypothetical protein
MSDFLKFMMNATFIVYLLMHNEFKFTAIFIVSVIVSDINF